MSNRKRGQAGREGPRGREKKGIIHVTIQIIHSNMKCRIENVNKRDERDHGAEH